MTQSRLSNSDVCSRSVAVRIGAVFFCLLVLLPLAGMLVATLTGGADAIAERWSFLQARVFDRLVNSVVLAGCATLLALAIGVPFAFAIHRSRFWGRAALSIAALVPLLIPPHIHAISWLRILGNNGYLTAWFADQGIEFDVRAGFFEIGNEATIYPGAIWMLTASFWPLIPLLMSAGFRQMDASREEAAVIQRGLFHSRASVALPALRPFIISGAFFVFLFSVGCYAIPSLLDTPTIMQEIWFPSNNVDVQTAAVVALPLVVLCLVGLAWVLFIAERRVVRSGRGNVPTPRVLRPRSIGLAIFAWGAVLLTAGWPFLALLQEAGPPETYRAVWQNVQHPETRNITNSVMLALGTAILLTIAATLIAMAARSGRRWRYIMEGGALISFAFPAIVVGVSVNMFWSQFHEVSFIDRWVYNGAWIGIFTWLALFLPFGVRSISAALDKIDPSLLEAAALTPRSRWSIFGRVLLPLMRPGILSAFLLGFILSLGELPAAMIVNPGRFQTAQVRIFNMIHFARDEEVAALCVIVILLALVPLTLFALLSRKRLEVL